MEIALLSAGLLIILAMIYYNKIVRRRNEADNTLGNIDTMLKNRYDLIPNLVDTVKNYLIYEEDVLNNLTAMRIRGLSGNISETEQTRLYDDVGIAVRQIMIAVENYPELKASKNFLQLQDSWKNIEDRISASRQFYNSAATEYNNSVEQFPANIVAKIMGFRTKPMFFVTSKEAENIHLKNILTR